MKKKNSSWGSLDQTLDALEKRAFWAYGRFKHALPRPWEKKLDHLTNQQFRKLALKTKKKVLKEVKNYTDGLAHTIYATHIGKAIAKSKSKKLLSLLDFPTKQDVARLHHRLGALEKKLRTLRPR